MEALYRHVRELILSINVSPVRLRGVGIGMSKLSACPKESSTNYGGPDKLVMSVAPAQTIIGTVKTIHNQKLPEVPDVCSANGEMPLKRPSVSERCVNNVNAGEDNVNKNDQFSSELSASKPRFKDSQSPGKVVHHSGSSLSSSSLTWTQVDPTALAELPEDIRNQQIAELDRQADVRRQHLNNEQKRKKQQLKLKTLVGHCTAY